MIESLTKLVSLCYRLLSILCRLLVSVGHGCQMRQPVTGPSHNNHHLHHQNGTSLGPSSTSGPSYSPVCNGNPSSGQLTNHNNNHITHNNHKSSNGKSSSPNGVTAKCGVMNGHCNQNGYTKSPSNGYLVTNGGHQNGVVGATVANGQCNGTVSSARPINSQYQNGHLQSNGSGSSSGPVSVISLPPYRRPIVPFYSLLSNYLCHATLYLFGHLNDQLRRFGLIATVERVERNRKGYAELYASFATFYIRNIIQRMINMWCHPIASVPGATIEILDRQFSSYNASWKYTGKRINAINMGSYNYLGFAENDGPRIDSVEDTIRQSAVGVCSVPNELGIFSKYLHLEKQVAQFLGVEESIVIGMGFATNALGLPCLFGPGCLVVSDENNHASLILGCRLSGAKVKVFKHNDMACLEKILRNAIVNGQPATTTSSSSNQKCPSTGSSSPVVPWKKIVILVEGIYSMEGTIVNLPEVIRLKRKYKAYLYMDEAHSIGAMGPRGRGICDYFGCDPHDVDLLMGTFTKSFAAAGGYIAGPRHIINYFRASSASFFYATTMAPPIVEQISFILDEFLVMDKNNNRHHSYFENDTAILERRGATLKSGTTAPATAVGNGHGPGLGSDGDQPQQNRLIAGSEVLHLRHHKFSDVQSRIVQLRKNALYFRMKLKQLGFHIEGHDDSPVVPIMVYTPANLKCLISELLAKGIASTGAAYPVTTLVGIRARFCLSAAHTDEMINYTLECLDQIGERIGIKFDKPKQQPSNKSPTQLQVKQTDRTKVQQASICPPMLSTHGCYNNNNNNKLTAEYTNGSATTAVPN